LIAGFVVAENLQRTSVANVFCSGEPTGIGGVDLVLLEGRIAGLAAAGRTEEAEKLAHGSGLKLGFVRAVRDVGFEGNTMISLKTPNAECIAVCRKSSRVLCSIP
jgi:hypothetical protein